MQVMLSSNIDATTPMARNTDISDAKHVRSVICSLSKDIVITIFMCLHQGKSRLGFASTCKKMCSVYQSPPCWSDTLVFPVAQLPHLRSVMQTYPVRKISFVACDSGMLGHFDVLGMAGAKKVARAITASIHLQSLDISCNHIGPGAARTIGVAIRQCPNLSELDLHHNKLSSVGIATVCEALTAGCPRLHTLDVSMVSGKNANISLCVLITFRCLEAPA